MSSGSETRDGQAGFREPAVRAALGRLQSRLGAGPSPASAASAPTLRAGEALRLTAAMWGLIPPAEALQGGEDVAGGPASLAVAAERLGLETVFQQRAVGSLRAGDIPALAMGRDGRCVLVIGRAEGGMLTVMTVSGPREVAADAVEADASGTLVLLRQAHGHHAPQTLPTQGRPALSAPAAAPQPGGPARSAVMEELRRALLRQRPLLTQLIVASVIINLLGLFLPLFSMAVFDRVIPHAAFETLWALALGVVLALGVELALRMARLKLFDAVGLSISHGLQGRAAGRLLGAKPADLPVGSGAALQPAQEMDGLSQLGPQLTVSLLVDLPFFLVMMALVAFIAGPIVFVPIAGALALVAVHAIGHALSHRAHGEQGGLQRQTQQLLIDAVAAQERIRVTGAAPGLLARFDRLLDAAGHAAHQSRYWHGFSAQASAIIVQAVIVGALVWGVFRIDAAALTIGGLSAVMLLVNRAMTPVGIAIGLVHRAIQGAAQAAPIGALLAAPVEAGGDRRGDGRDAVAGRVDLAGAGVRHANDGRDALKDVTISIRPGERIGLIGKAGCGKSTLMRLMVRLVEPASGAVRIDERDIRHFDPAVIRAAIAYMPQDSALVDGTLEDNLTLGLGPVPPARFAEIARLTGVAEIARAHPKGYSMGVGPGGQRLSGGERQLVSLARALMGQPRLLLLDEPTAALDNAGEARLIGELRNLPADCGMVIATHRLQLLSLVDRVIWMEGGRVMADGPKAEVFQRIGVAA